LTIRSSTSAVIYDFTNPATLSFDCPHNWAETGVNGAKNYWLRVRITAGDYGQPVRSNVNIVPEHDVTSAIDQGRKILTVDNQGYVGGEFILITKNKQKLTTTHSALGGRVTVSQLAFEQMVDFVTNGAQVIKT